MPVLKGKTLSSVQTHGARLENDKYFAGISVKYFHGGRRLLTRLDGGDNL